VAVIVLGSLAAVFFIRFLYTWCRFNRGNHRNACSECQQQEWDVFEQIDIDGECECINLVVKLSKLKMVVCLIAFLSWLLLAVFAGMSLRLPQTPTLGRSSGMLPVIVFASVGAALILVGVCKGYNHRKNISELQMWPIMLRFICCLC